MSISAIRILRCITGALLLLPICQNLAAGQDGGLALKYRGRGNILRGSPILFRLNATDAPQPEYPLPLILDGKSGLVVVETVVSPKGRILETLVLESFDDRASSAVLAALNRWRFHSEAEMIASGVIKFCNECLRINRLAFDFRIEGGKGRVVDLAAEEIRSRRVPDPFQKKKP